MARLKKGEVAEKTESKTGKEYYQSRLDNSRLYNPKNYSQIILRIPIGYKDKIIKYVQKKAEEEPDNPKYNDLVRKRPSVNAFITSLIEEETGIQFEKPKKE